MKRLFFGFCLLIVVASCQNNKKDEKAALDRIITVHDRVMDNDGELMKNKMRLDTLIKTRTITDLDSAKLLSNQLNDAETKMDTWMHNFDPDHQGKTHEETMAYMAAQQKGINTIDSLLNAVIKRSTQFLGNAKVK